MDTCSLPDCQRKAIARGLCASHYQTQRMAALRAERRAQHRPCQHCGKDLAGKRPNSMFCNIRCKEAARAAEQQAERAVLRAGRICVWCGNAFESESGRALTCSRECGVQFQNAKRSARRLDRLERKCESCGGPVPVLRRLGAIYCSEACKRNAISVRWRERAPGYMRRYLYGVTPEQYAALLAKQDNRCAICKTDTPNGQGGWHVDHDHTTGAVRGLLCNSCNLMLGQAKDDPDRLRAALAYLSGRAR